MSEIKICVISDTHGDSKAIEKILLNNYGIDTVIHLGDNDRDVDFLRKLDNINLFSVKGNCDFDSNGKSEDVICVNKKKIFITHGDRYDVKYGYQKLYYRAMELDVDMVMFGHTHNAIEFSENGISFFNPGSIYKPKSKFGKSYGIVKIDENIKIEIINFK